LKKVVECQRVEGVVIDENEISSLEEMMKEASQKESIVSVTQSVDSLNTAKFGGRVSTTNGSMADPNPISRQSMQAMAGDDNDLLTESPVFAKAKGVGVAAP
jgi:hypothetical protein